MIAPKLHPHELQRLASVRKIGLLDTEPEKDFDSITSLAAIICQVPIALVTLLDMERNFLKSHHGVPFNESPREISFCGHAILEQRDVFIVEDARKDIRFINNPLVVEHQAIFYAGVPLYDNEGLPLGTLCIFDTLPRTLNEEQKQTLIALARQVENLFELKRKNTELNAIKDELAEKNEDLKNFAATVSHDLKMPLARMLVTTDLLKAKYQNIIDSNGLEHLNYLKKSALTLGEYITDVLNQYGKSRLEEDQVIEFDFLTLLEEILDLLKIEPNCEIKYPENNLTLRCQRSFLGQIFLNLIGNSLKYNKEDRIVIELDSKESEDYYYFKISDNGMGISKEDQKKIFDLFNSGSESDRSGNFGHGIGLATVKKLVTKMGGKISVKSELGAGTSFQFSILK